MDAKGFVNIKFIVFLKATLGKMMATEILPNGFIDLHFWQSFPRKFYNIKSYQSAKETVMPKKKNTQETHQESQQDNWLIDEISETNVPNVPLHPHHPMAEHATNNVNWVAHNDENYELSQSILLDLVKFNYFILTNHFKKQNLRF